MALFHFLQECHFALLAHYQDDLCLPLSPVVFKHRMQGKLANPILDHVTTPYHNSKREDQFTFWKKVEELELITILGIKAHYLMICIYVGNHRTLQGSCKRWNLVRLSTTFIPRIKPLWLRLADAGLYKK